MTHLSFSIVFMKYFTATSIYSTTDEDTISLAFYDDADDPIDFAILTHQLKNHASFNMHDTGLLLNDTDREFFNVIESMKLFHDELVITICAVDHEHVEYDKIVIDLNQADPSDLRDDLRLFCQHTNISLNA